MAGQWGEVKFGLSATQVLQLVDMLREANSLESLQLLHFHLGSQLSNIRDISTGVRESARFYVELHKLGVNIQCFDVGGAWASIMKGRALNLIAPLTMA